MPSENKTRKIIRSIKSVNPIKELLTLPCEWHTCEFVTDRMSTFINHVADHLGHQDSDSSLINNIVFECQWQGCGHDDSFTSFAELARHVYFHAFHAKLKSIGEVLVTKNSLSSCQLDSSSRNMIPDLPDHLQCVWDSCQEYFDNPELYYVHVLQHADIYPGGNCVDGGCMCHWEGCSTVTKSKHRLKEHLRSHTQEKVIACSVCGGLFSNSTKLFDHIKRQGDSDTQHYQCSHCNRHCSTERLLRDHMRQHVNHYRCPFCEKTCPNPSSLRTHVHYRHTETREYSCSQCDYCAKSAVDLRRHEDNHSRMRINCEVEGCTFHARYIWDMRLHCRNAHEGGTAAKYLCHVCGKKYCKALKLTAHLCKKHQFKKPQGHTRFRYKQDEDGFYRLLTIRYESVNMTEHTAKQTPPPHFLLTPVSNPILIQPDFINEANSSLKRETGGFVMLSDCEDMPNPAPAPVQPTYYLSSAIANAFHVCESQENLDQSGSMPSVFLLQSNSDLASAKASLTGTEEPGSASWRPCDSSVYYLALHENLGVEQSSNEMVTESHLLKVFQQDGIGTVVASVGKFGNLLTEAGGQFSLDLQSCSSSRLEHEDVEETCVRTDDVTYGRHEEKVTVGAGE